MTFLRGHTEHSEASRQFFQTAKDGPRHAKRPAIKAVLARQFEDAMKEKQPTKAEVARRRAPIHCWT